MIKTAKSVRKEYDQIAKLALDIVLCIRYIVL